MARLILSGFFNNFKALKMIRKVKYRDQPQKEIKKQLNPLFLILKTEFFNKILSGEKKKEFREISDFYCSRFLTADLKKFKNYDSVIFQNGYHTNARKMKVELKEIRIGLKFTLQLGEVISKNF